MKKYQEDLSYYQSCLSQEPFTPKDLKNIHFENNEYATVEEEESEEEPQKNVERFSIERELEKVNNDKKTQIKESTNTKEMTNSNIATKGNLIFSHCNLNELKTHLKNTDHPQKTYNSMKIRK